MNLLPIKQPMKGIKAWLILGIWLASVLLTCAQTTNSYTSIVNALIPDGNSLGMTTNIVFSGFASGVQIQDVDVTLDISGGYNGDLYAYLVGPSGGYAVLLNRVGVSSTDSFGYGDAGFNITLDDRAANGNIHYYENISNPNGGTLMGTWAPDGENTDPNGSGVGSTPATALLSSFNGTSPNGTWTLFIADLSGGDQSTLVNWGITIVTIPEPPTWTMGLLGVLLFFGITAFRRKGV